MNNLPQFLKDAIKEETQQLPLRDLKKSRKDLEQRYRNHQRRASIAAEGDLFMNSLEHRFSYLTTRMPATYAVIFKIMQEVKRRLPDISFQSLLDLGSGPGTVLWAASEALTDLKSATLIEQDEELISLAKRLALKGTAPVFASTNWQTQDILNLQCEPHDLVVLSYVIGELPSDMIPNLIERCWSATNKLLLIVEPGTPAGFHGIWKAREQLIRSDAYLIAPCPHKERCPMAAAGDWCHFSERLERTSEHRFLKEGSLGYEDEKYSYVAAGKQPCEAYHARILRHPQKHSGHIGFTLCTKEGLKQETISRRMGETYKQAKKSEWGDIIH